MNAILFIVGLAVLAAGVAQISVPAAMIAVGAIVMLLAVLLARADTATRPERER